jgi:aldose 1-epimerase
MRGGAVREFRKAATHLFRPTPPTASDDPFQFACFPMVPFVNRISNGRFVQAGREVRIDPNWDADPHPLHGQGWRAAWQIRERSASSAVLTFEGGGDEWPWPYRCEQLFDVRHDGLTINLAVQNQAKTLMPAMIGLHPYFPQTHEARLEAHLPRVWRKGQNLAVEEIDTPMGWQCRPARAVTGIALDHSFSHWPGTANIAWRDHRLNMRATNCGHLHIYTPPDRDFFCLEPQTAAAGAFNRDGSELAMLEPGVRLSIQVDFNVELS